MKLATFLAGGTARLSRRGSRRRDRRPSRPAPSSTASRPATARPPTGAGLRARATSRCWSRSRARRRSSASAATTPRTSPSSAPRSPEKPLVFLKLPLSSVPPQRAGEDARRPPRRSTTRSSSCSSWAPDNADRRLRGRQRRLRPRPAAQRGAVVTRQGLRHARAPGARGSRPRTSSDPLGLRITTHVNGELRQDGNTRRPDLQARASSSTSSPRPARSSPARSSSRARRAASARRSTRPATCSPATPCRCEIEGLGVIEHSIT